MKEKRSNELRWLIKQATPFFILHLLSLGCVVVASLMMIADPLIMKWIIDDILPSRNLKLLPVAAGGFLLTFIGQYLFNGLSGQITFTATQRMIVRIRGQVLQHLLTLSPVYYDKVPVGELQHRVEQDVDQLVRLSGNFLTYSFRLVTVSSAVLIAMIALNPVLTSISLPLLPAFLFVRKLHERRLRDCSTYAEAKAGEVSSFLQLHLSTIAQIQLLCAELRVRDRFSRLADTATRAEITRTRREFGFFMLSLIVLVSGMALVLGYGGRQVIAGTLSTGGLVAFYSLLIRLFEPLGNAVDMVSKAQRIKACCRRVLDVIETEPVITEPARAIQIPADVRGGELEFDNVHFAYATEKPVLSGISISIKAAERVALIGASGSGKSTLAKLATRLYDVDQGAILLGGHDIRQVSLKSLRETVSLLPQEPVLLGETIRENLLHGKPNASERELDEVAWLAQLRPVINRLSEGWDHPIGPRAAMLSGGERQRLALARIILRQPRILILDEFTSALDSQTEHQLLEAMDEALSGTTLIVISHRISTALWADRILMLDQGRRIEEVSRSWLLKNREHPENFAEGQLPAEAPANGGSRALTQII
jgi:ABC-type multidrug transport system fused ATPase/permease subunit